MKILLAEANGALAGRLFHLLIKNGYQTTAVKTGQAALGLITAVFGLIYAIRGRGVCGSVLGWVASGFGLVTVIFGFCAHFQGYIYPIALYDGDTRTGYAYSSHLPVTAVIVLVAVAILFALVATLVKHHARKQTAAPAPAEPAEGAAAT